MTTHRRWAVILVPPLLMTVLLMLPLPGFVRGVPAPLFAFAIIYAVALGLILFWGGVWISGGICRLLGISNLGVVLGVLVLVQLSFMGAGAVAVRLATPSSSSLHVFRDGLQQTAAFLVCYGVYRVLLRRGEMKQATPNFVGADRER
ncbi:MAG TPA: hypothetical protein VMU40_22310 [Steroidobacteraceae bacterium]|nr:hypothetical protein [Steroidobacteraceae bacterium]